MFQQESHMGLSMASPALLCHAQTRLLWREKWGRQDYAGRDEQCLNKNKSNFKSHQFVRLLKTLD